MSNILPPKDRDLARRRPHLPNFEPDMVALLSLLLAAVSDGIYTATGDTRPVDERLARQINSLLEHAGAAMYTDPWIHAGAPVPNSLRDRLLTWLTYHQDRWISRSSLDDIPRLITYERAGCRLSPILTFLVATGTDPMTLDWQQAYRHAMVHVLRTDKSIPTAWLLGPAGIGKIAYRFVGEPESLYPQDPVAIVTPTGQPVLTRHGTPLVRGTDTRQWSVQQLHTDELIRRDHNELQFTSTSQHPQSILHHFIENNQGILFSLRDESGRPLMALWLIPATSDGHRKVGALGIGGVLPNHMDERYDRETIGPILRRSAEFLLFLQPDVTLETWAVDSLSLLFEADDRDPLVRLIDENRDQIFRRITLKDRTAESVVRLQREILEEMDNDSLYPPIRESWYRASIDPKNGAWSGTLSDGQTRTNQVMLPMEIAQLQLKRTPIDRTDPILSQLVMPDFELDDQSNGQSLAFHEARFMEPNPHGPYDKFSVLQVLVWWNGFGAHDGEWIVNIHWVPVALFSWENGRLVLDDNMVETLRQQHRMTRRPYVTFTTHDFRTALQAVKQGYEIVAARPLSGQDPRRRHLIPLVYDDETGQWDDGQFTPEPD